MIQDKETRKDEKREETRWENKKIKMWEKRWDKARLNEKTWVKRQDTITSDETKRQDGRSYKTELNEMRQYEKKKYGLACTKR